MAISILGRLSTHIWLPLPLVISDGLIGKFDTLRVALEHIRTHGTDRTLLAIQGPGEELQFAEQALHALLECFDQWVYDAGLLDLAYRSRRN